MAWASVAIPAAASIIGGMMSSDAAGDAAGIGAAAADRASAVNKYIFDKQVELQQPFRDVGVGALNRLAYLMGIPQATTTLDRDQIRQELLAQFTRTEPGEMPEFHDGGPTYTPGDLENILKGRTYVDEVGLNKAVEQRLALQANQPAPTGQDFGALMKKFGLEDFQADPGYQFRRTEGMKGIENSAAARGNLLSGSALKAIQKYGQDLASQEYGNAYSRFNADQTNQYNKLAGLVNTGQGASNQLTNAAANYGSNVSNNITSAGNAQAAGVVGQANAWNNAIGQGTNLYQQNQLMNLIRNPMNYYNAGGSGAYTNPGSQQTAMLNAQWQQ